MTEPNAKFYYDQMIALIQAGARPSLAQFAGTCHVFRAAGYRAAEVAMHNQRGPGIRAQNSRGEWVPAIPEPLFISRGRVKCDCGEKFRGRRRFREHYALAHVLALN